MLNTKQLLREQIREFGFYVIKIKEMHGFGYFYLRRLVLVSRGEWEMLVFLAVVRWSFPLDFRCFRRRIAGVAGCREPAAGGL